MTKTTHDEGEPADPLHRAGALDGRGEGWRQIGDLARQWITQAAMWRVQAAEDPAHREMLLRGAAALERAAMELPVTPPVR